LERGKINQQMVFYLNLDKTNDSTFLRNFIKLKDTIHFETIVLQQIGDDLIYSANVKVKTRINLCFSLTETVENKLVFENQNTTILKISYQKS
jgi:hypothetical protein